MNVPPFEPRRRELLLATLALLGGCGGVDSGGTGTGASSTYASGPITGLGSIFVNGVRYDDSSASIDDDDGRTRSRDELKLGMRAEVLASAITVAGGVSSATASSIRVHSEIVGPLEAIDSANARLTVLGQSVAVVVGITVFDTALPGGLAALARGDVLEVYATLDIESGHYVASRIERQSSAAAYKLRGVVMELVAKTLGIGGATIDWSGVAPSDPATALAPGQFVRVTLATTAPAPGVWRATALTSGVAKQDDREAAEVEGRITAFNTPTDFVVNGLRVDASAADFPDGKDGLARGVEVEVRGSLRDGVLVASRVEVEDESEVPEAFELNGKIDSVEPAAMRFVVRGVTAMWSVTVVWSAATRFDGDSTSDDIKVGRTVEVKGRLSADGLLIEAVSVHVDS